MIMRCLRPAVCRRTLRQLQSYLDGESDEHTTWRVSRHLSRCHHCFGDADTLRAVKDAVARLRVAPDGDTLVRLRQLVATLSEVENG